MKNKRYIRKKKDNRKNIRSTVRTRKNVDSRCMKKERHQEEPESKKIARGAEGPKQKKKEKSRVRKITEEAGWGALCRSTSCYFNFPNTNSS